MGLINFLNNNHNISLNSQQEQAVFTIDGATLLLAVPGSGKTTVIITRIGNLIYNCSVLPEQILTLTFSVAATRDMKERFSTIFGGEFKDRLEFRTIHSFCFMVIREYERLTNKTAYEILNNNNQIIKKIYLELNKEYIGEDILNEISQAISYCKNMMFQKEQIEKVQIEKMQTPFSDIFLAYDAHKKQNRLMDYDDMLEYAYIILTRYPEILEKFQNEYKYINVDEAQDTSFIQHEIIRILAQKNGNIFMVGDEDQSIYGFRAAFPKALMDFKDTYSNAKILFMERNYRSTKKIVGAANRFIKQNRDRYQKNMFCDNDDGFEIKQTKLNNLSEQYDYLIETVKRDGKNKSLAILYSNNDSAIPVVDALEKNNIPFYIRENTPTFFSHFVTSDIKCFIRLAKASDDINAFEKIYYKMNCRITKQMFEFVKRNLSSSIFDTLLEFPDLRDKVKERIQVLKFCFNKLKDLHPLSAIEYIENQLGYLLNINKLSKEGYSKESLIQKLNVLKSIAANNDNLNSFYDRLAQLEDIMLNSSNQRRVAVTLSTVHSSKGLEFDKVIIIDAIDGQFPSKKSITNKNLLDSSLYEEEARLFYVGVTRARDELEFITSNHLYSQPIKASRFIQDLLYVPKKRIEKTQVKSPETIRETQKIEDFEVGVKIIHNKFGEGIIRSREENIIYVDFDKHGFKKLCLNSCIKNNLLQKTLENIEAEAVVNDKLKETTIDELRELALHIGNTGQKSNLLIELFNHSDYEVRRRACSAAKKLKDKEIVKHITPCLFAEEAQIRQYSLGAVLKSKCFELIDTIIKVKEKEDKDYNIEICDKIIESNKTTTKK